MLFYIKNGGTTESDDLAKDAEIVEGMEGIIVPDNNAELFAQFQSASPYVGIGPVLSATEWLPTVQLGNLVHK